MTRFMTRSAEERRDACIDAIPKVLFNRAILYFFTLRSNFLMHPINMEMPSLRVNLSMFI